MEIPSAGEKVIATCPLGSKNKEDKLWLTEEHLQLLYRGQLKVFALENLRQLAFNHRKLMLPLVAGGVTATLSLVAIFKLFYNPWLMLSLLVAGCLAAFIGFRGSWVLTVQEEKYHSDFFLPTITPALQSFVQYTNTFTGHQPKGILYLPLFAESSANLSNREYFTLPAEQRLYYRQELGSLPADFHFILPLNSLDPAVHINWKTDPPSGKILPFLQKGSRLNLKEHPPVLRQRA
ncbi:hypothetical protein [Nafulsella turpanensis]|uniref:hypothetical protein n=1 Tax=Nafulsella turpanensis TaxID=1265690 RepID=UPI00034D3E13|nr:hypothetical protein [Nafulsella turpanensis]